MKTSLKVAILALTGCVFSGVALADAYTELNFNRLGGHFSCSVSALPRSEVIIDTENVKVTGPACDGHAIHTTARDLNKFAYKWERDGLNSKVKITVKGKLARNLTCKDDQAGRPEAPGGKC